MIWAFKSGTSAGSDVFAEAWNASGAVVTMARSVIAIPTAEFASDLDRNAADGDLDSAYDPLQQMLLASDALRVVVGDVDMWRLNA